MPDLDSQFVMVHLSVQDLDRLVFLAERAAAEACWYYSGGAGVDFDDLAARLRAMDPNPRTGICPACRQQIEVTAATAGEHSRASSGLCPMSGHPFRGSTTRA